jgi:hypothetical protein
VKFLFFDALVFLSEIVHNLSAYPSSSVYPSDGYFPQGGRRCLLRIGTRESDGLRSRYSTRQTWLSLSPVRANLLLAMP